MACISTQVHEPIHWGVELKHSWRFLYFSINLLMKKPSLCGRCKAFKHLDQAMAEVTIHVHFLQVRVIQSSTLRETSVAISLLRLTVSTGCSAVRNSTDCPHSGLIIFSTDNFTVDYFPQSVESLNFMREGGVSHFRLLC